MMTWAIWLVIGITVVVLLLGSSFRILLGSSDFKREAIVLGLMFVILTPIGIIAWKVGETLASN